MRTSVLLLAILACALVILSASAKKSDKKLKKFGKKLKMLKFMAKLKISSLSDSEFHNGQTLVISGSGVRIRSGACTDKKVITNLNNGATVKYQGESKNACGHNWLKVSGSFGTGYVAQEYVREEHKPTPGPTPTPSSGHCFPVKHGSFNYISWNFGQSRQGGYRCHAGVDIMTKGSGDIVAVADGTVVSTYNFYQCSGGMCDAVLIYHPSLGMTINYGEINSGARAVHSGQHVSKGQHLGRATVCGMLHFEMYEGKIGANQRWMPPSGHRIGSSPNYCREHFLSTKPHALHDGTNFLKSVQGKFC